MTRRLDPCAHIDPAIDLSDVKFTFLFYNYAFSSSIMVPYGYLQDVLGHTPSMTALSVAAILKKYRTDVNIVDAALNEWDFDETVTELKRHNPEYIGLTICSADFNVNSRLLIQKIKREIGCNIIVGGELATLYPGDVLKNEPSIDYVTYGQCDFSLGPLLAAVRDRKPLHGIRGIAFRDSAGETVVTPPAEPLKEMDTLPYLPYELLEHERYLTPQARAKNYAGALTVRGCPYNCSFCYERLPQYVAMSPTRVVDELEWGHREFAIREFDFWDPTFNINAKRVEAICDEIIRRRLKIVFSIHARPDLMSEDLLRALKKAGCIRIQYGVESGDKDDLELMDRRGKIDLEHTRHIVRRTNRLGMETAGYMIAGLSGQTEATIDRSAKYLRGLKLDYTISLPAYIGPGTQIYEDWKRENPGRDYWREIIESGEGDLDRLLAEAPQYFSLEERLAYVGKYLKAVYLRPHQVLKVLTRDIRHPVSLWSKVRAGSRILRMVS